MKMSRAILNLMFIAIAALAIAVPTFAQDAAQAQTARVAVGRKQKISGVVVSREADKMVVRDINGSDVAVNVTGVTKIVEKKANPFRSAKNYPVTALLRGLEVEIEGRGDSSGALVAEISALFVLAAASAWSAVSWAALAPPRAVLATAANSSSWPDRR